MSEPNSQEPTMEEILASIRRIISEDDAPVTPEAAVAETAHSPVEEDILELTDRLDGRAPSAPEPSYAAPPRPAEPLVSAPAASSAASAFGHLERTVGAPADGRSLEDVVSDLLRPLLKAWLDEHLAGVVKASVEAEVARIARLRR
jgi:cell pole-organizing protein PopZ